MSIFRQTFPQFVQTELNRRQNQMASVKGNARTGLINELTTRNAWIRMTSGVNINDDDGALAKEYVLQGGTLKNISPGNDEIKTGIGSSFDKAYSNTSKMAGNYSRGIRPMPGITSMTAECKTAYGSLIEATVNFTCWDIKQLEDLELLYMRPGYTVLVEWGWAYSGRTPNYYDILSQGSLDYQQTIKELFDKSEASKGNYEAIFGYVKNYSWRARIDGGYDCTTHIISMGEVLESLKVNYSPFNQEIVSSDGTAGLIKKATYLNFSLTPIAVNAELIKKQYSKGILSGLLCEILMFMLSDKFKDAKDINDNTYPPITFNGKSYDIFKKRWDFKTPTFPLYNLLGNTGKAFNYYISLKSLCDLINDYVLIKNGDKNIVKISIDGREYANDSESLKCIAHPLQISTDPTKCLIRPDIWLNGTLANASNTSAASKNSIQPGEINSNVFRWLGDNPNGNYREYSTRFNSFLQLLEQVRKSNPSVSTKDNFEYILNTIRVSIENSIAGFRGGNATEGQRAYNFTNELGTLIDSTIWENEEWNIIIGKDIGLNVLALIDKNITAESLYDNLIKNLQLEYEAAQRQASLEPQKTVKTTIISGTSVTIIEEGNLSIILKTWAGGILAPNSVGLYLYESSINKNPDKNKIIELFKRILASYPFQTNWGRYIKNKVNNVIVNQSTEQAKKALGGLEKLKPYFVGDDYGKGNISNIYFDIAYLVSILEDSNMESRDTQGRNVISILDFLKRIIGDAQSCIGNINNFDVHIDKDGIGRIIDINVTEKKQDIFQLEVHNTKSIVRNYSLESKIFPEQGTIIAISAQSQPGDMGYDNSTLVGYNRGITDRLIPRRTPPTNNSTSSDPRDIILTNVINNFIQIWKYFTYLENNKDNAEQPGDFNNALRDLIGFFQIQDPQFSSIIPVTLSFDMDGIGGIVIGNLFKVNEDILPKGYKFGNNVGRELGFLVKSFNNKIENNDWITTIEAYPYVRTKDTPFNSQKWKEIIEKAFNALTTVTTPNPITLSRIRKPAPIPEDQYTQNFNSSNITNPEAARIAKRILSYKDKYTSLSNKTKVPWYVIGIIHYRESDLNFNTHLHNGNSLKNPTVDEPAGRPNPGGKNFTFEESAIDALSINTGATNIPMKSRNYSSIGLILKALEEYNGLGYTQFEGINSPYIWSGTNLYTIGKYREDGKIDMNLKDSQIGAAAIIKELQKLGVNIP
jgi:lysozyme family protein